MPKVPSSANTPSQGLSMTPRVSYPSTMAENARPEDYGLLNAEAEFRGIQQVSNALNNFGSTIAQVGNQVQEIVNIRQINFAEKAALGNQRQSEEWIDRNLDPDDPGSLDKLHGHLKKQDEREPDLGRAGIPIYRRHMDQWANQAVSYWSRQSANAVRKENAVISDTLVDRTQKAFAMSDPTDTVGLEVAVAQMRTDIVEARASEMAKNGWHAFDPSTVKKQMSEETGGWSGTFPTNHPRTGEDNVNFATIKTGDQNFRVIPTVVNGEQLSKEQARKMAESKGLSNYPQFKTEDEAQAWSGQNKGLIEEDGRWAPGLLYSMPLSKKQEIAQDISKSMAGLVIQNVKRYPRFARDYLLSNRGAFDPDVYNGLLEDTQEALLTAESAAQADELFAEYPGSQSDALKQVKKISDVAMRDEVTKRINNLYKDSDDARTQDDARVKSLRN